MAAVTVPGWAVGIVAEKEVILAIVGVRRPAVAEQVAGRELVQGEQHVIDDRVPDSSALSKGQVVGVAERIVVGVGPLGRLYRRGIVEECLVLALIGVEGSRCFVRPRGARGRGRAGGMTRLVLHCLGGGDGYGVNVCVGYLSTRGCWSILRGRCSSNRRAGRKQLSRVGGQPVARADVAGRCRAMAGLRVCSALLWSTMVNDGLRRPTVGLWTVIWIELRCADTV